MTDDHYDLEKDLKNSDWIVAKARASDSYAQNIYAALCNILWQRINVMPILREEWWSCSWRYAGGIVADILGEGGYLDWYCSGIMSEGEYTTGYVSEGEVTEEIQADFRRLGWHWKEWSEN